MQRLFSITLSLIILLQGVGLSLHDITQIDEFIAHANYHNKQYGDNVLVFISKHYGELKANHEREHHEEKSDHEQLPFQHLSHVCSIPVFILNSPSDEFKPIEFTDFKTHHFFYQEPFSSLYLEGLFQPPRHS